MIQFIISTKYKKSTPLGQDCLDRYHRRREHDKLILNIKHSNNMLIDTRRYRFYRAMEISDMLYNINIIQLQEKIHIHVFITWVWQI